MMLLHNGYGVIKERKRCDRVTGMALESKVYGATKRRVWC
jgi:hypothetical protein